jgi:molybdenum cofactor cytidylyltransferase
MPFVPTRHFERLLAHHHGPATLVATSDGVRRMSPAVFGADWFALLETLSGDRGAQQLLGRAEIVVTEAENLLDVDRPEDLARARARLGR